ncbi:diguanylate cyclase domain-containing protein [Novosphingobium sp.]|uniref:GGDEF domain-containing protein n=1 Tax=Novosphingobium sp. TaxID=1874826 RepID=UPI0038BBD831
MSFLSLFSQRPHGEADTAAGSSTSTATPLAAIANAQIMERIHALLIDNHLAVTPHNLLFAHAVFSGQDAHLARKLTARIASGAPITQDWVNQAMPPDDRTASVGKMVERLEKSLETFVISTRKAHRSAASYNDALERQVADAGAPAKGDAVHDILVFANAMLERTRALEAEMKRRESEAQHLKKRLARARRDADLDHLTGLPNRRAFEALLETSHREANQQIEPLSVAFCDIDNFKNINDKHGHDTGDRVIQAIAEWLARLSNARCHVARHGGEEFVLLFRGLTKEEARVKLDAVRETFADRRFVNRSTDEPIGKITFSGGVADVFAYANPRAALKAADEALYRAKATGRNRIVAAP